MAASTQDKKEPSVHDLILQGNIRKAQELIQADPKIVKKADEGGRTPLHWACSTGQAELVNFILSISPNLDVDVTDDTNLTPLIIVASAGKIDIVRVLLGKHADVDAQNSGGHSGLQYAASKNHVEVVQLLLENGANVNIRDSLNATPLHRAASQGHSKVVRLLLEKGGKIEIDPKDSSGNTPLHLACEENRVEEAKLLVHHGADIKKENKEKQTPLSLSSDSLASIIQNISDAL